MPSWAISALIWLAGLGLLLIAARWLYLKARRALLLRTFENPDLVETIMSGQIAQGMTHQMVMAAWGKPADMDETVMKTQTKSQMKYDQKGKNRFGTRVYFENGVVVGWETK